MSIDLGRRLIAAGVVSPEELEAALFVSVARGVPLPRVLVDRGALSERALEEELERLGGLALRQVTGAPGLVARLPRAMCRRLSALPTRVDPATGVVDVAATDPLDPHIASEIGFHLGAPVRVLRAPIGAVEDAIRRLELDEPTARTDTRHRRVTPPFPHGAPQSSNPPPAMEESPIPLVRKAIGPIDADVRPVAPAPRLAVTAPSPGYDGTSGRRTTPGPFQAVAPAPQAPPPAPAPPAAPRVSRASATLPAVSFPSQPPPDGDRTTPPYGTPAPVLAPPAAPVPRGPRVTPAPETLRPTYGGPAIAAFSAGPLVDPPADLRRPTPTPASQALHGPPSPAPTSASQATGRRTGRPSLSADLPYPGGSTRHDADADAADAEPAGPRRVRAPDGRPVIAALEVAASRDEVVRLALRGTRLVARRVAVFVVRRDGFHGWTCNVDFGDAEALQHVVIPADQPSALATAAATPMYLGRIPPTPAHDALLSVMERSSPDVAVVAAKVSGRAAMILIADELSDTMTGTRFLLELARGIGEALGRLISGR